MMPADVFGIVGTTQAGNFRVERVVAEGGFGVVYKAHHEGFRAPIALKCLKIPEELNSQQRTVFLEKFREEAELMFRLSGAIPEVCRPLHVDVLYLPDGRFVPFLALEWLNGQSLDGIITRRREQGQAPLGVHKLMKMMRPIARALSRAHHFPGPNGSLSIIHRDLKPENLFIAEIGGKETIKVLDFGVAKAKRAASQAAGRVTGASLEDDVTASFTPAYGAPEQWSPKSWGPTGPWTDVWGLALTMVEALIGRPPIDGDTYEMKRACMDEKHRPTPRSFGAPIPVEVDNVFATALSVDPRKRYKDVDSFWSELERAMGIAPTMARVDHRREPHESLEGSEGARPGAARVARIELQKQPVFDVAGASEARKRAPHEPAASSPPELVARRAVAREVPLQSGGRAPVVVKEPAIIKESPGDLEFELPSSEEASFASLTAEAPDSSPELGDELVLPSASPTRAEAADLEAELPTLEQTPPPANHSHALLPRSRQGVHEDAPVDFDLAIPGGVGPAANIPTAAASPNVRLDPVVVVPSVLHVHSQLGCSPAPESNHLRERLRAPLAVLLLSLFIAVFEVGYTKINGVPPTVGSIRPFWVAAPLALFGVAFTLWRFISVGHDDD